MIQSLCKSELWIKIYDLENFSLRNFFRCLCYRNISWCTCFEAFPNSELGESCVVESLWYQISNHALVQGRKRERLLVNYLNYIYTSHSIFLSSRVLPLALEKKTFHFKEKFISFPNLRE